MSELGPMRVTPEPPAAARPKVWKAWHIVAVVVAGLILIGMFLSGILAFFGPPNEEEVFRVGTPECRFVEDATAYIALPLAPVDPERMKTVYLDSVELTGAELAGAATVEYGYDVTNVSRTALRHDFLAGFAEGDVLDVDSAPGTILIRLERTAQIAQLDSIVLFIGYGEPASQQTIPVDVTWSGSTCEVHGS